MKRIISLTSLLFFFFPLFLAAQDEPLTTANLSSPYHAIKTHMQFLQEDNFRPGQAAKAFSAKKGRTEADKKQLALRLKQILDGEGIYIDIDVLPRDKNYTDSLSGQHKLVLSARYPQIYLVKGPDNRWRYSEVTALAIDGLYKDVYPFGSHKLLDLLPLMGPKMVFGIYLWQYLTLLAIVVLCFVLHKLMTFVFRRGLKGLLGRMGYLDLARQFILPIARPASLLLVLLLLGFLMPLVQLQAGAGKWIFLALRAGIPLFTTLVFYRLVSLIGVYLERKAADTKNSLDDQMVPLIRKSLRTFVVIIGMLFILDNLDFNVTAFLAGLSIGGLAFALAAQDTLKNFFGSLMIFVDKPFQIGDLITSPEINGTVEHVGFRSTRIRTFTDSVTCVPNGKLADAIVDNHGLRHYRRFNTKLAITYDTPPQQIMLFTEGLRRIVEQHPLTRKDLYEIHLNELAAHSLEVLFYIFFDVRSWSEELKARHDVLLQIIQLAQTLGVRFAFPTQTLHMESLNSFQSMMPVAAQSPETLRQEMEKLLSVLPKESAAN